MNLIDHVVGKKFYWFKMNIFNKKDSIEINKKLNPFVFDNNYICSIDINVNIPIGRKV